MESEQFNAVVVGVGQSGLAVANFLSRQTTISLFWMKEIKSEARGEIDGIH
jgi:hypothetical protein